MNNAWPYLLAVLAVGGLPLLVALYWHGQWRRLQDSVNVERRQAQEVFDTLDIGLLVFDAEDRVVQWNADYLRLYPEVARDMRVGMRFEDILRSVVRQGAVPAAQGREDAWVAERLAQHRQPREPLLRQMADGRWRRITERYLANGGMVSYSIDVTALVAQGQDLEQARAEADRSRARLLEAIEVLPAGIEWFDADDRLVLANGHSRDLFPLIRELFAQQPTFEQLVRANHAAGGLPNLPGDLDTWISRRLAQRRAGDNDNLIDVTGRWFRLYERHTADGGIINVRIDVTEEIRHRETTEAMRQQLQEAIEALPDGFALFDADDRLVLCNERYRTIYRESAPAIRPGVAFIDVLRYGLAHGQYPQAAGREDAWLAERVQAHREPGPPVLQELPGNRWLRIDERRTRSGGVAGVRADVTALVRREQTLAALNRQLDHANARLSELLGQDPDTGAASAAALEQALTREWARSRRHGTPLALLRVHIEAPPDAGDGNAPMQALARHLAGCARRPGDLLARTAPRGFALLLPHTGTAALAALVQRCSEGCRQVAAGWTVQVGAAASDELPAPESPDDLQARAEPGRTTSAARNRAAA